MDILFCGDENAEKGIFLSVLSLCKHAAEAQGALNIYVLTAAVEERRAISPAFARRLQAMLDARRPGSLVQRLDVTALFLAQPPTANMATRFTPLCMLRLFADEVEEIPDRVLYLDADVLCRSDPGALFSLDMGGAEIAGVPDRYGKWFFGNILRHDYLNSGVLLLDMAAIRRSGLFEKCRRLCRGKEMFMPDQTALNQLAVRRKLPRRYNEQGKIRRDTVFKHFTTYFEFLPWFHAVTIKPWDREKLHNQLKIHEFDDLLEEYDDYECNFERDCCCQ